MSNPPLTFRQLTSTHLERAKLKLEFVLLERDLFKQFGPTAGRTLTDDDRRQLARFAHALGWKRVAKVATIASVKTMRRWHQRLIGIPHAGKATGGRTQTSPEIEALVVQFALENNWGSDAWGANRIVGELRKQGISLAKSTVSAILRRHGIPPAPQRGRVTAEDKVIMHDPATTAAIDFAKVLILDHGTVCLVSILIAIHLGTREIEIVNVSEDPDGANTLQCARNLTMAGVGFFKRLGIQTVIMDHDPIFTAAFRDCLASAGCQPHRITPYCPWENGYAERFIRSLRTSVLRKVIFASESTLRKALAEFQVYFNTERPHQGLDNNLVTPSSTVFVVGGKIIRHARVGGLINHYERAA